uniref:Uncharacterized protein n=1 Tax=Panagrolaimus superbus TaxID=310955 RepID=A0A914Y263_9BILA
MHYIARNPKNAKVYQKLVQSCKYFFIKNPILVYEGISFDICWYDINENWLMMNQTSCKLWITHYLQITPRNHEDIPHASSLIPKIYQFDLFDLNLSILTISYNVFMSLCSSVKTLSLNRATVKNDDGTVVSFEKIIEQLPNSFELGGIREDFDIDIFYSFMKKNKNTRVHLKFSDQISEEYKARLEAIVDEIIATKNREYKPPLIDFRGLHREKSNKLFLFFCFT